MTSTNPVWSSTHGTYLAGEEAMTSLDIVARDMERKWGADRLRLLVDETMRSKFDSQRIKADRAIMAGTLAELQTETRRMILAWQTLDRLADQNPANHLPPTVWEVALSNGLVIQIVRESDKTGLAAAHAVAQGRPCKVFSLEDVANILARHASLYTSVAVPDDHGVVRTRDMVPDFLKTFGDRSDR